LMRLERQVQQKKEAIEGWSVVVHLTVILV